MLHVPDLKCNCDFNLDSNSDLISKSKVSSIKLKFNRTSRSRTILPHKASKRDREPSRISTKKVINSMKHKKVRKRCKTLIRKFVPASLMLHKIATSYKQWYHNFSKRQHSFSFFCKLKFHMHKVNYNVTQRYALG